MYWQSINFVSLIIEEWEGEYIVFHPESGKTHFLNQMGMQIIVNLHKHSGLAIAEDEICSNLVWQFQLQSEPSFFNQVKKTLIRFEELGLIELGKRDYTSVR